MNPLSNVMNFVAATQALKQYLKAQSNNLRQSVLSFFQTGDHGGNDQLCQQSSDIDKGKAAFSIK